MPTPLVTGLMPGPVTAAAQPATLHVKHLHDDDAYLALRMRDARLDGRLFVGVTSTGIYCRPVCRVRPPKRENCRFFANAATAEQAGFRPCLRCRPELAPGLSLTDSSNVLADQAAHLLGRAAHDGTALPLPALAARLGITDRHLRRIFAKRHGVTPLAWLTTQRLLLAKQLLTDTAMPITEVALATGFGSLRRFNAAFVERYRLNPSGLRRAGTAVVAGGHSHAPSPALANGRPASAPTPAHRPGRAAATAATAANPDRLRLAWRPPYDVAGVMAFLAHRAVAGLEEVQGLSYRRTLALAHQGDTLCGWLSLRLVPERAEVHLTVAPSLRPALGALLQRTRQALDLDAEPALIAPTLASLPCAQRPGVRLPGAWCGFESAVRVVLGQQVTVAAARTLTHRLVQRFGEPVATPFEGLDRLFPSAKTLAAAAPEAIGTLGIVRQRVKALQALACAVSEGRLDLHPGAPLADTLAGLTALPGIGDWSAQLIALRALAWPDAWPASDIGLLNALGTRNIAEATARAEAWRPWRAYALMTLWLSLEPTP